MERGGIEYNISEFAEWQRFLLPFQRKTGVMVQSFHQRSSIISMLLADRLLEKEKIGVVPRGIFPAYCAGFFPDEEIIGYINLPYYDEGGAEVAKHCIWQELPEVRLCI